MTRRRRHLNGVRQWPRGPCPCPRRSLCQTRPAGGFLGIKSRCSPASPRNELREHDRGRARGTNERAAAHSSFSRNDVNTNKRVEEADRRRHGGGAGTGTATAPYRTDRTGNRTSAALCSEAGRLAGGTLERSGRETEKRAPSRPTPLLSLSLPSPLFLLELKSAPAFHSYDIPHERTNERERAKSEKREHDDGDGLTKRGGGGRA